MANYLNLFSLSNILSNVLIVGLFGCIAQVYFFTAAGLALIARQFATDVLERQFPLEDVFQEQSRRAKEYFIPANRFWSPVMTVLFTLVAILMLAQGFFLLTNTGFTTAFNVGGTLFYLGALLFILLPQMAVNMSSSSLPDNLLSSGRMTLGDERMKLGNVTERVALVQHLRSFWLGMQIAGFNPTPAGVVATIFAALIPAAVSVGQNLVSFVTCVFSTTTQETHCVLFGLAVNVTSSATP